VPLALPLPSVLLRKNNVHDAHLSLSAETRQYVFLSLAIVSYALVALILYLDGDANPMDENNLPKMPVGL